MGVCVKCGSSQPRLKAGGQCTKCFNTTHAGSVKARNNPANTATESGAESTDIPSAIPGNKPINELTVDELKIVINDASNVRLNALTNRIKLVEDANKKKDDEIAVLKSTIVAMQRSINLVDHEKRKTNVIVTGLTEENITPLGDASVETDRDKVQALVSVIQNPNETFDTESWRIERIGNPRPGFVRAIKIVTPSSEERDKLLRAAPKVKEQPEPWNKVYLKKDLHPVYSQENARIRKRRKELTDLHQADETPPTIVIERGELKVNGITVDRNLFFA